MRTFTRVVFLSLVAAVALIATSAAMATKGQDFVTCDNGKSYPITVTQQPTENSVGWGVARIGNGDHLIPTSFSGTIHDDTIGKTLDTFTQAKGNGNGQHNQAQLNCQSPSQPGTLADFLGGDPLPPNWALLGAQLTDQVTVTFTVTAVLKS